MFTITVGTGENYPQRVESFDTLEEMRSMYMTYLRCGIHAVPSQYVDAIYDLPSPRITFGR